MGVKEIYVKNDAVNYPTLSFKDRVVSVALSRARELGFKIAACASTGNLANSVAANAAAAGMESFVFIPSDLEQTKIVGTLVYGGTVVGIKGTYDEVNRLCSEIAGKYGWAFVNINIRPYYAEGSKTFGYEIAEQLGWKLPQNIVVPMAGGSLITKIHKAFKELSHPRVCRPCHDQGIRGPGGRMLAHNKRGQGRHRAHPPCQQAQYHCQVACHRQPG